MITIVTNMEQKVDFDEVIPLMTIAIIQVHPSNCYHTCVVVVYVFSFDDNYVTSTFSLNIRCQINRQTKVSQLK